MSVADSLGSLSLHAWVRWRVGACSGALFVFKCWLRLRIGASDGCGWRRGDPSGDGREAIRAATGRLSVSVGETRGETKRKEGNAQRKGSAAQTAGQCYARLANDK